jgi:hypothetical protein
MGTIQNTKLELHLPHIPTFALRTLHLVVRRVYDEPGTTFTRRGWKGLRSSGVAAVQRAPHTRYIIFTLECHTIAGGAEDGYFRGENDCGAARISHTRCELCSHVQVRCCRILGGFSLRLE